MGRLRFCCLSEVVVSIVHDLVYPEAPSWFSKFGVSGKPAESVVVVVNFKGLAPSMCCLLTSRSWVRFDCEFLPASVICAVSWRLPF